ncbi:MAG: hypothetical protein PHN84_11010 [Desulfuromonadaceae bacterium]|nr:hypothetical protein [Desulfuromonadaceae bacterium]MDD2855908.1 hypothetical protein [Desulfuromonadaceae bacterium]
MENNRDDKKEEDPVSREQLSDWLSGRHSPFKKNREKMELFLENQEI